MVQSLYKTDSWFKKSHEDFRQTLESPDKHWKLIRLSTARLKINQINYVIFEVASQFSFKFCITLKFHDT